MNTQTKCSLAFNAGCQCRLDGLPITRNRYSQERQEAEYNSFRNGWIHTNNWWGIDARWPYKQLPAISDVNPDIVLAG